MIDTGFNRFIVIMVLLALSTTGCRESHFSSPKQRLYSVVDKPAVLATVMPDDKPVVQSSGLAYHAPKEARLEYTFSDLGGGVFYTTQKAGMSHVVHNGMAGKPYKALGEVKLSPDGKHVAYGALVGNMWRMVVDGVEGMDFNTVKAPIFSPDSHHLVYQAMKGEKWYLVLDSRQNSGTMKRYLRPVFSGDSLKIAYVDDVDDAYRGRLLVSDIGFEHAKVLEPGGVSFLATNDDNTRVVTTLLTNGKQQVIDFSFAKPADIRKGPLYDSVQNISFGPDGVSLVYMAERGGKKLIVLNNREEPFPDGALVEGPLLRPDLKGAGAIISNHDRSYLWQFSAESGKVGNEYDELSSLSYSKDGKEYVCAARRGSAWFIVVNGKEGPSFDRVVSPKISPDGKYIVYRARKDMKRFVVVADISGKTIRIHPSYEQVFDVQFTLDGRSVAYGVKDGQQLAWKVEPL
ncbi:hypothetical protein [Geotalea sp. SG265]|uniref:TolB family protein n=1 Tax=Geotalea sp. SG265 TaxID=2922867 RepID=UPI001FAFBED3|nr:hypothetical protein [Geotalea sp. SG265]